jgi:POT family proton-dependent oligopeptide transporter
LETAKTGKGHPKGLYLLFTVEMWERFGYYGMRAILGLYMAAAVIQDPGKEGMAGLGLTEETAGLIANFFQAFVYLTPLLGGFLADAFIGQRRSILMGGLLMGLGYAMLAVSNDFYVFVFGLILITFGNGFFKPNISTVVGDLYEPGDKRKDTAFTIFYMGINLGALVAPIVCGWFRSPESGYMGYSWGFGAASAGMFLGLLVYVLFGKKYLGDAGMKPKTKKKAATASTPSTPLTKVEKDRIWALVILAVFNIAFWTGFDLAPTSITFFTENHVNKDMAGLFTFDTAYFQSLNPLMIVVFAPLFALLWTLLSKAKLEPNTPTKMGIGIVLAGAGFLFMYMAALEVEANSTVMASIWFVMFTYVFHTFGELCLSPIGLSMVTKLAPPRLGSLMMGVWFGSVFIANIFAGLLVFIRSNFNYSTFFLGIALVVMFLGLVLLLLSGRIRKMMHNIG